MSPDEAQQLDDYLAPIRRELASLEIPPIPPDGFAANQIIAAARTRIAMLDIAIFGAFRILSSFHDKTYVKPPKRKLETLTIDDL